MSQKKVRLTVIRCLEIIHLGLIVHSKTVNIS